MNQHSSNAVSIKLSDAESDKRIYLSEFFFSFKTLLAFVLAFFILGFLSSKIDIRGTLNILKHTRAHIFTAGFLIFYASIFLRAIRWRFLLGNIGCVVRLIDVFEVLFLSWFANVIVPAKLGDLYRSYLIHKNYNFSISKAFGSIFTERIFDMTVLLGIFCTTGIIGLQSKMPRNMIYLLITGGGFALVLIGILFFMKHLGSAFVSILPRRLKGIYQRFELGTIKSIRGIPFLVGWTILIWLMEAARLWFVTESVGYSLPTSLIVFVALASSLLTTLPITPAGLGAVEISIVAILGLYGIGSETGMAIAILDRLISYWSIIPLGYLSFILSKKC